MVSNRFALASVSEILLHGQAVRLIGGLISVIYKSLKKKVWERIVQVPLYQESHPTMYSIRPSLDWREHILVL